MHIHDWSIKKKLLLSHFLMIGIPVFIVMVVILGILFSFLMATGSQKPTVLPGDDNASVSGYMLQLTVDSLTEQVAHTNPESLLQNDEVQDACESLQEMGANTVIYRGDTVYCQVGSESIGELWLQAQTIIGNQEMISPIFYWTNQGFVYHLSQQNPLGETIEILIVGNHVDFPVNSYQQVRWVKTMIKIVFAVSCVLAVVIIIIMGVLISNKLSKTILVPLNELRRASNRIQNGDLNGEITIYAQDELGLACQDFDQMRRRLQESVQAQQAYEQGRKELIAGISHDLSTPLTSIKGYVSGLLDGIANTPEKQEHYLKTIYHTACDMEHLVDSLFLFSKLDLGKVPFHWEIVSVVDYFTDYMEETKPRLLEKDMKLSLEIHTNSPCYVRMDRLQFGRVVSNLVDNSVKYKRVGLGILKIIIQEERETVQIIVKDNGIGVSPNECEKLFDSFYRTDPARTNAAKGSGLGLSITKQIVENMNGSIWAKSAINEGMEMHLEFQKAHKGDKT